MEASEMRVKYSAEQEVLAVKARQLRDYTRGRSPEYNPLVTPRDIIEATTNVVNEYTVSDQSDEALEIYDYARSSAEKKYLGKEIGNFRSRLSTTRDDTGTTDRNATGTGDS